MARIFGLALLCAILLCACGESRQKSPRAPVASQAPTPSPAPRPAVSEATGVSPPAAPAGNGIRYFPSRERALARGDSDPILTAWQVLGARFDEVRVLYGLLIAETPLGEQTLPRGARVTVLSSTEWESTDSGHRKLYTVKAELPKDAAQSGTAAPSTAEGSIDSSSCLLVLSESGGLSAGIIERKIGIAGGESEFNILAIIEGSSILLIDTSAYIFADSFHPSGVLRLGIEDMNSDGTEELVMEADTIVSFNYLGATPLRWECWLRPRAGSWAPVFQYNVSFATDEGYAYVATRRALDADGDGFRETVKVITEQQEIRDEKEFTNTTVSFYIWSGSEYAKDPAQELPRQATVSAESADMRAEPGAESALVETVPRGTLLYVFDRSDSLQSLAESASFWFKGVSKSGTEGWVYGGGLSLAWIDPLKVNREAFLGKPQ